MEKVLFVLVMIAISIAVLLDMFNRPTVHAQQPRSARLLYETSHYSVYCESPTGNVVYVSTNPQAGGAALWIEKGACR